MILDPSTDRDCLGQLTQMARELAPTTLMRTVATRLGSPRAVVKWIQSLPQTDDNGDELIRYVSCDVPQRVRLLPDDPNCFERAFAAIALLEVLDPRTARMLVTIDRPVRHTGVVERKSGRWVALDLFPRRNFDWGETGKDVLQGAHSYVGKPLLSAYGLGGVADTLGGYEDKAIGRDKSEKQKQPPAQSKSQTKPAPKQPAPAKPQATPKVSKRVERFDFKSLFGTGAQRKDAKEGGGDGQEQAKAPLSVPATADSAGAAADGDSSDGDETEETKWGWG